MGGHTYYAGNGGASYNPNYSPRYLDQETRAAIEMHYRISIYDATYSNGNGVWEIVNTNGTRILLTDSFIFNVLASYRSQKYQEQMQSMMQNNYTMPDTSRVSNVPVTPSKKKCSDCGEDCPETRDHHGWCKGHAAKFWKTVNKLYWSRANTI